MQKAFSMLKLPVIVALSILLLYHISAVTNGVKNALEICAFSIIPSLLVFLVLSDVITAVLLSEKCLKITPRWIAFLLGSLCGFPVGAIVCDRFCQSGALTQREAERLLPMCNNTSPAFVLGAIGAAMIGDVTLGALLFVAQFFAALLLFLPVRVQKQDAYTKEISHKLSEIFFTAIERSVGTILRICVLICVFSALLAVLRLYCSEAAYILLSALLEIGNGAAGACTLFVKYPSLSVAVCGFVCGWSGICVHFQIFSSLKSIKVNVFRFCICKSLQGILTATLAFAGYKLFFCS